MALARWEDMRSWDPFRELEDMTKRFDRVLRRSLTRGDGEREGASIEWAPTVDIAESEKSYEIRAELPGVQKKDVQVSVEQDVLTLRGERRQEKEEKDKRFHRVESMYGAFMRRFTLPADADPNQISANFKDGVLAVEIPKTEAKKSETKEVTIK